MDWAALATGIGIIVIVIFHFVDHFRNREKSQKREGEIQGARQKELEHIQEELEHPIHGLDALNTSLSLMKENCASFTSSVSERLYNLEGNRKKRTRRAKP